MNEDTGILKLIVGFVVGTLLLVGLAIPVISAINEGISSAEQNADELYLTMTDRDTLTFTSNDDGFTMNGETMSWLTSTTGSTPDRYSTPLVFGSDFMIAPPINTGSGTYSDPHVIHTGQGNVGASHDITIADGKLTLNDRDPVVTIDINGPVYYASEHGTYGLYKTSAHIDNQATAYVLIYDWNSASGTRTAGIYKVNDGTTSEVMPVMTWTTNSSTPTTVTATITADVDRSEEVSYLYTLTGLDTGGTAHAVNKMTLCTPITYHVIDDSDRAARTVASLAPLLLGVVLVIGLVLAVTRSIRT